MLPRLPRRDLQAVGNGSVTATGNFHPIRGAATGQITGMFSLRKTDLGSMMNDLDILKNILPLPDDGGVSISASKIWTVPGARDSNETWDVETVGASVDVFRRATLYTYTYVCTRRARTCWLHSSWLFLARSWTVADEHPSQNAGLSSRHMHTYS